MDECVHAVEQGLAIPERLGATRRAVADELFYRAGTATSRAVTYLYEAIALDPAPAVVRALECPPLFQPSPEHAPAR